MDLRQQLAGGKACVLIGSMPDNAWHAASERGWFRELNGVGRNYDFSEHYKTSSGSLVCMSSFARGFFDTIEQPKVRIGRVVTKRG
jgi:hypothetical protein